MPPLESGSHHHSSNPNTFKAPKGPEQQTTPSKFGEGLAEHEDLFKTSAEKSHPLSDQFIIDVINNELKIGNKKESTKGYMDHEIPDQSDRKFMADPEAVSDFHDQLTDLLSHHLKVFAPEANETQKGMLEVVKQGFIHNIKQKNQSVRSSVKDIYSGKSRRVSMSDLSYKGFTVTGSNNKTYDLLEESLPGSTRANMKMQEGLECNFIHWRSSELLKQKFNGEEPELKKRIYLNPKSEEAVEIFDKLITAAEQANIPMVGKILDRGIEALAMLKRSDDEKLNRTDGIVLVAGDKDANELLEL